MNKKRMLILVCLTVTATGALTFGMQLQFRPGTSLSGRNETHPSQQSTGSQSLQNTVITSTPQQEEPNNKTLQEQSADIPETHVYLHTFKHINFLNKEAENDQKVGADVNHLKWYRDGATLTNVQTRRLSNIANQCVAEIEKINNQARSITNQLREKYPVDGGVIPPIPDELKELDKKYDATILSYSKNLKVALGDEKFGRFRQFLKNNIEPKISVLSPDATTQQRIPEDVDNNRQPKINPQTRITDDLPTTTVTKQTF